MTLTVLTPPGEAALSLAEAKTFLRIGHDGEDVLVADLIAGAQARLEEAAGLVLVKRTLRRTWFNWPGAINRRGVTLRPGPVISLVAVRIVDAEANQTELTNRFAIEGDRLCAKPGLGVPSFPAGARIEVDFEAGFGLAEDVPDDLVQALKLILQKVYRRNDAGGVPEPVAAILAARREVLL